MPLVDLHCDLLGYLAEKEGRTPYDCDVLCSLPQLKQGGVTLQVLAFFSETGKKPVKSLQRQMAWFERLLNEKGVLPFSSQWDKEEQDLTIVAAIENASGLCDDEEELDQVFIRFDAFYERVGLPLYVSLTWNDPNRFGGGNLSDKGLTRDGELFLDFLDARGVSIDMSHTSDALAEGILNYIHKKGLKIIPIASHSNFREIVDQPRNLPDPFVKEIVKLGGIVGINLVRDFIGRNYPEDLLRQVEHARTLGILDHYCFGTDFFHPDYEGGKKPLGYITFHKELGSSACFPHLLSALSKVLSNEEKEKVAYKNFLAYLEREEQLLKN